MVSWYNVYNNKFNHYIMINIHFMTTGNWNFDLIFKLLYDFDAGIKSGTLAFLIRSSTTELLWPISTHITRSFPIVIDKQTSSHHIAPLGASSSTLLQYWKVLPGLILGCWNQEKTQTQSKHTPSACIFKKERFNWNEFGTDTYKLFSTSNVFNFAKFKKKNQKDLLCIEIKN